MTYDALDRVITTEDPFGLTLTYTYDADGNRIEVQDSLGGVTTYIYDADNELISEQFGGAGQTPLRIDMTYDGRRRARRPRPATATWPGPRWWSSRPTPTTPTARSPTCWTANGVGNTVANFTYTYDIADRVLTEDNSRRMTTTYTYDADNQLTSEVSPLATINYTYDANGNRTGGNNVIGPNNQLLSDGTWNYTYDADGNLIQKVGVASGPDHGITWTYTYDNGTR